jgi:hypothetical protein
MTSGYEGDPNEGPMSADLFGTSTNVRPRYADETSGSVTAYDVERDGVVLGRLWCGSTDDAASWVPAPSQGDVARNVGIIWKRRLSDAKSRGLSAQDAVTGLLQPGAFPENAGAVSAVSRREFSSLEEARVFESGTAEETPPR